MKKIFAILIITFFAVGAMAQKADDPVIFEVNGKVFYKSQFMKDFLQSIGKDPSAAPTACTYEKRKALEDYVQLFVNFQTKLEDAYALGFDTLKNLQSELKTYRKDLAAPFLIDSATMQSLLREAYDRNHYALHAAHILVHCPEASSPEDTLKAYQHAMELYNRAITEDDFYKIAQDEMRLQRSQSRDPLEREKASQDNPLEGDLGYFTVFDMIYAFESAAYAMQPGAVSLPVRTRYGYHIIKLFDRYEYYGKVQLAHIWVSEDSPNAKGRINSAYNRLKEGTDFGVVAKNASADRNTANNGGIMPELSCNQLPPEYVEVVAKGLQVGEYSEPFHSRFGWHIIKLLKKETMPPFESLVPYYKSRMTRGERSTKPQHIFIDQCKSQYDFVDYTLQKTSKKKNAPMAASLDAVRSLITDSLFSGIFHCDTNQITDLRPLFKIGTDSYDSRDLANYIMTHKKVHHLCDLDLLLRERYEAYIDEIVLQYADDHLEQDNAEFGALMNEYRHGLMIFAYNDYTVWSRAVKDSVGFAKFYETYSQQRDMSDSNDAVYFWNDRARVSTITVTDSTLLPRKKAVKEVEKAQKKGWDSEQLVARLADKAKKGGADSVFREMTMVEKGNQQLLQNNEWHKGVYYRTSGNGYKILIVEKLYEPELKSCQEARGYYLNEYQNYLEAENIRQLREKYNVKIHQDVVDEITY